MGKNSTHFLIIFLAGILSALPLKSQYDILHQKDSLRNLIVSSEGKEKLRAYNALALLPYPDEQADTCFFTLNKPLKKHRDKRLWKANAS